MPDKNKRRIFFIIYMYICPLAEVWTALLTKEMRVFFLCIRSAAFASRPPIFGWRNERAENWVHTFLKARGIVAYHHVKLRIEEKKAIQCAHTKHTIQVYKNVYQQPDDNDGSFRYYVVFSSRSLSLAQFGSVSPVDQHMRAIRKDVAPGASPNPNISFVILCVYIFLPFLPFFARYHQTAEQKNVCALHIFFSFFSPSALNFRARIFPVPDMCVVLGSGFEPHH